MGTLSDRAVQRNDLLYVSEDHGTVFVFTYPQGFLQARLTGFSEPEGICVDSYQDVLITDFSERSISEYAHGSSLPITILHDAKYAQPIDCSVDPLTGDLAVANYDAPGGANVEIFPPTGKTPGHWGKPRIISDPKITIEDSCGYDDRGNLYIDGLNGFLANAFAMLPRGSNSFVDVTLPSSIKSYLAIRWDGQYITLGDPIYGIIYRLEVSGSHGRIVGKTQPQGSDMINYYSYHRSGATGPVTLVGPNRGSDYVALWHYPAGGSPIKTIPIQVTPNGAAVSGGVP